MKQPTIYYILNARWPTVKAHGLQVAKTCEALAKGGAQVTLVVPNRRRYPSQEGADWHQLYDIHTPFSVVYLWSPDWVYSGPVGRVLFSLQQFLFAIRARVFIIGKTGTVYSRDMMTTGVLGFFGRHAFWEVHRVPSHPSFLFRFALRTCAGVVAVTTGIAEHLFSLGVSRGSMSVVPDAVDVEAFNIPETKTQARERLQLPFDDMLVGYVGQLNTLGEGKGVDILLHAVAAVPSVYLAVVGGSPQDVKVHEQLARKLGIAGRVRFTGHILHQQVPLWLRAMDIVVMPFPDTEHYRSFMSPLKLFEYMAAGKIIVASDLPSVREILNDESAVFVSPGNPAALAKTLSAAAENPAAFQGKGERARQQAVGHTWDVRAETIVRFVCR